MTDGSCDVGRIGLAVMGQNLVLNMNDHGHRVSSGSYTAWTIFVSGELR